MRESLNNQSGIVGVVDWKATMKRIETLFLCLGLFFTVAAPGLALAQPEIPLPPTIYEEPPAPQAPVVPQEPAPIPPPAPADPPPVADDPGPPAEVYVPPVVPVDPAPAPPVQDPPAAPAAPPVDVPEVEVPQPAPVDPPVGESAPEPQQDLPTQQAPLPATPDVPAVSPEPSPQAPVQPEPQEPTTDVERSPTVVTPSQPQIPGQSSSSAPSPELEVPNQPDATSTEQPSSEPSSVPDPSGSATPSSESETAKEESKEPVVVPDPEPVKVNEAVKASESEMQTLAAAKSDPAPEADQKLVDEALMSTMGSPSTTSATPTTTTAPPTTSTSKPPTTSVTPTTTKKPWPGGHDKPWECKGDRGPRGCHWDGWKPGHGGHPVFTNPYKEYWQLVQWLDRWNNRHQKWVPPHSHLPVHVQNGGVYGFAILTLSARHHGVTLGVAFGAFSSPGIQCVRHPCHVPPRPTLNATFLVYIPFGPYRDRYVPRRVYDCGCEPVYRRDGRDYYRYYFEGYREVIVYKETRVVEGRPQQVIVPVEYRQTPVQRAPVPVTAGNVGDVVGIMPPGGSPDENPEVVASPDLTAVDNRMRYIAISTVSILIVAAALVGVVRVRRRRN